MLNTTIRYMGNQPKHFRAPQSPSKRVTFHSLSSVFARILFQLVKNPFAPSSTTSTQVGKKLFTYPVACKKRVYVAPLYKLEMCSDKNSCSDYSGYSIIYRIKT